MERYEYKKQLIYGTMTAGGSLAILIPPSGGKIEDVIIGSLPFLIPMLIVPTIITLYPSIVLFLPELIQY